MPQVKLVVDNETVMDVDLLSWTSEPPAITDLKTDTASKPWAIPTMQAIASAAINQQDTTITVRTRGGGWGMDVTCS